MAEAVELGADLADLGGEKFIVVDQFVLAKRATGGPAGDAQQEGALAEARHALFVRFTWQTLCTAPVTVDNAALGPIDADAAYG
jgi:hypothetical protein